MKYDTLITGWGECALEFLNEDCNFLIISMILHRRSWQLYLFCTRLQK